MAYPHNASLPLLNAQGTSAIALPTGRFSTALEIVRPIRHLLACPPWKFFERKPATRLVNRAAVTVIPRQPYIVTLIGWTTAAERCVKVYDAGRQPRYTKMRRPVNLIYVESHPNRVSAMKRERLIKTRCANKNENDS